MHSLDATQHQDSSAVARKLPGKHRSAIRNPFRHSGKYHHVHFKTSILESPLFRTLERFVVALYDRSCSDESVNELRKKLFCLKSRPIERLPPTQDALLQHTKRACYQSGVWTVSLLHQPQLPSPRDFGWKKEEDSRKPIWMTQPTAAEACTELVKCKCTKGCGARCACKRADWSCTHFCSCPCVK